MERGECSTSRRNAFDGITPDPSSTSPAAMKKRPYDVFINHRGCDTKKTLASTIYHRLDSIGIHAFLDGEELELGDKITDEIQEAMDTARVHIAIFSPRYAESAWCLAELHHMIHTGTPIFPIFYCVEPSDLRLVDKGKGCYAAAFSNHEQKGRYSSSKLHDWKTALHTTANLFGHKMKGNNFDEEMLFEPMVKFYLNAILQSQPVSDEVSLPEYPKEAVGIKDQLEEVNSLLKMESSTDCSSLIIILWGVGGIGKTTLADAVVSKINKSHYNYARITLDENSEYNKNKYTEMQQQILKDAFPKYMGGREMKLRDTKDGKDKLKEAFTKGSEAIFLYIDNALDKKDLEELLPKDLACLPKKSRILITSRTMDIAEVLEKGDRIKHYLVQPLSNNDAMELLCRDPPVRDGLKANLEKIVDVCRGYPLLLKIVGAHLRKEKYDPDCCGQIIDEIINDIKEGNDINDVTKDMFNFVYEKLYPKTKEAFLDICCCFHNSESRRNVEKIVGFLEVRRLEEAALITPMEEESSNYKRWSIVKEERLSVHDIIRSIGHKLGKSKRIMDVHDWVEAEKDEARLKEIEVVYLKGNEGYTLQGEQLKSMKKKLRILYFEDNINVCVTGMVTLPELRMARIYGDISWLNFEALNKLVILTCQQLHIPHTALLKLPESLKRISILFVKPTNTTDLLKIKPNSSLEELFVIFEEEESEASTEEEDKASIEKDKYNSAEVFNKFLVGLNNLKFLHILNCESLSEFPEQICRLPQLVTLFITFLGKSLPRSIGLLTSLKHLDLQNLDLGGCDNLDELPSTFGQLTNLTHLHLRYHMKELPETFGQLTNLTHLNLEYCRSLKELPKTFGQLTNLTHLDLTHVDLMWRSGLKELPETFGQLTNLTHLVLRHCDGLKELPETFGQLTNLTHLNLEYCRSLKELPKTFGQLTNLTHLDLMWCGGLKELPETFGQLTNLTHLDFTFCGGLKELPETFGQLTNLTHLDFIESDGLKELPETFGQLTNLTHLVLRGCFYLKELPETFGQLTNLTHLVLRRCISLKEMPETFGQLTNLTHLNLEYCMSLKELPKTFGQLTNLTHLDLNWCRSLKELPETFGQLKNLTHLDLRGCYNLKDLPETFGQGFKFERMFDP